MEIALSPSFIFHQSKKSLKELEKYAQNLVYRALKNKKHNPVKLKLLLEKIKNRYSRVLKANKVDFIIDGQGHLELIDTLTKTVDAKLTEYIGEVAKRSDSKKYSKSHNLSKFAKHKGSLIGDYLNRSLYIMCYKSTKADSFEWIVSSSKENRIEHLMHVGNIYPLSTGADGDFPGNLVNCKCGLRLIYG